MLFNNEGVFIIGTLKYDKDYLSLCKIYLMAFSRLLLYMDRRFLSEF